MKNYISENLRLLISRMSCTQDEFGSMFDLGRGIINQYLKEKSLPKIDTIQKICTHFDLSIDEFINTDLSKAKDKTITAGRTVAMAENGTDSGTDKDAIIAAQRETIETQKELIANLRSQLNRAS